MIRSRTGRFVHVRFSHDYAHTLNLPKSLLANRSDRSKVPEQIRETSDNLYKWQREARKSQRPYILHDGPPYANGKLHLGHALNKILKDFINRYNVLAGRRVEYVPGWDCHGLPIELASVKNQKKQLSAPKRRELAKKLALKMVQQQKESFRSYAIMADWDTTYKTLTKDYVVRQLKLFAKLVDKKMIFRQRKPVFWSVESGTALAESELEYGNRTNTSVYLRYEVVGEFRSHSNIGLAVWTTTPWTLPSNVAIAIKPDIVYALVESPSHNTPIVVSKNLLENVLGKDTEVKVVDSFLGEELLGLEYRCPLTGRTHKVVKGDHVTEDAGTGLVHTAPGHGKEDFVVGMRENLEALSPVDAKGCYTSDVQPAELAGMDARTEGSSKIISILEEKTALLRKEDLTHSVPLDWRSKTPVMVRATPQFFIDLGTEVRDLALESLEKVSFKPKAGKQRLVAFTSSRSDWCISRQRVWGVPIPVLYRKSNGEALMDQETISHIISVIDSYQDDEGLMKWFEEEENVAEWLPAQYKDQGDLFTKGSDTMDVWFDSGTSWTMVPENELPVDYYLEGSDQHRGWFQSSLLTRVAATHKANAPYRRLITHGFLLDGKGQKMSKSLGNVVAPEDMLKDLGVDGLRLFFAQSDYTSDISLSPVSIKQVASMVKKFRLTFKFLLGNLPSDELNVSSPEYSPIDRYILAKLHTLLQDCQTAYENQDFSQVIRNVQLNMNTYLSSLYFDTSKDILYADSVSSARRLAIQNVLCILLDSYVKLMAPIMPLLTQEVWDACPSYITKGHSSPATSGYPTAKWDESLNAKDGDFEKLIELRSSVNEAIELARSDKKLGSSLACELYINPSSHYADALAKHRDILETLFITSKVVVGEQAPEDCEWVYSVQLPEGTSVQVVPPTHHKCPRCWVYTAKEEDSLCQRCEDSLA